MVLLNAWLLFGLIYILEVLDVVSVLVVEEVVILVVVVVSLGWLVLLLQLQLLHSPCGFLFFPLPLNHLVLHNLLPLELFFSSLLLFCFSKLLLLSILLLALERFENVVIMEKSMGELILEVLVVKKLLDSSVDNWDFKNFIDCWPSACIFCEKGSDKGIQRA